MIHDQQDRPKITLSSDGDTITFHDATTPVVLDAETLAELLAARAR